MPIVPGGNPGPGGGPIYGGPGDIQPRQLPDGQGDGGLPGGGGTPGPGGGGSPAPTPTPTPPPTPTPAPPWVTAPQPYNWDPMNPFGAFGGGNGYDPNAGYGQGGGMMPGDYNDPYNAYLASIPEMEIARDRNISAAMAKSGLGGNRYSSGASRDAAQIGAETAITQNRMLNELMFNQANADQNRALQAAGQANELGQTQDQLARSRLDQLFDFGQYEQGRQDKYGLLAYQDFIQSRLGLLPLLLQGAMSQGMGQPVQTVSGGSSGLPWEVIIPILFGGGD